VPVQHKTNDQDDLTVIGKLIIRARSWHGVAFADPARRAMRAGPLRISCLFTLHG
jgi:hypothetical protein